MATKSGLSEKASFVWERVVGPHPAIEEPESRNQARLAAVLFLTAGIVGSLLVFASIYPVNGLLNLQSYSLPAVVTGSFLLILAYLLSRSRQGAYAVVLLLLFPVVGSFLLIVFDPGSPIPFLLLAFGIVLCGGLFSVRTTLWACLVAAAAVLLLASRINLPAETALFLPLFSLCVAAVLGVYFAWLRQGYLGRISEQGARLQSDVVKYHESEQTTLQMAARGEALARSATRLNAQLDFDTLLHVICEEMLQLLHFPAASVILYDSARDKSWFAASIGLPPEYSQAERKGPQSMFEKNASQMGSVMIVADVQHERLADAELFTRFAIRTIGTAAMTRDDKLIGGLNIYSFDTPISVDENERALFRGLADQAALAVNNVQLFSKMQRHLQQVQALHQIDRAIIGSTDLALTLNTFIDEAMRLLKVDAVSILLFNPATLTLDFAAGRGFLTKEVERSTLRAGEGHAGRAVLEQRMVKVPNLKDSGYQSGRSQFLEGEGFVTYFGVPLIIKGEVKGILDVFNRSPLDPDEEWLKFLETLAGQAAIAVASATLFSELQRRNFDLILAYDTTLEGWSHALDLRDKETEGHTQRVTSMALQLAKAMGLNDLELTNIRRGALLHDIGKMGVPDHILLKHGELSEAERIQIEQHPTYAREMLVAIDYLHDALDIPYCHHEKWDGSGYPRGLKGEQIPLAARIFAVVDVWDAVTSDRPYRKGWKKQRAIEYLRQNAGTHFDTKVVDVFLRMVELV